MKRGNSHKVGSWIHASMTGQRSKWCKLKQLKGALQEMGTNRPWNWRLCIKQPRRAGQTADDQSQDDCRSWLCCYACSPFPQPIKIWLLIVSVWGQESQPLDRCLLPFQLLASKINIPFHQPGLSNGFWAASSQPHSRLQPPEVLIKYLTVCTKESVV